LEVQQGLRRVHGRSGVNQTAQPAEQPDRLDLEPSEFHERVRQGYLALAGREPERFRLIPAAGSIEEVQRLMRDAVEPFLLSANS